MGLDTTVLSIHVASLHSLEAEDWTACQEPLRSHAKKKKKPLYSPNGQCLTRMHTPTVTSRLQHTLQVDAFLLLPASSQ